MAIQAASKAIRTRVFDICEERGIKMGWLARRLGITGKSLSRIKGGEAPISRKFIEKSCEIFGMQLQDLFFVEDVN